MFEAISAIFEMMNIWAVLVAAIAAFLLGGVWYSPALFGSVWCKEAGRAPSSAETKKAHSGVVYIFAFLLSLIAATVFALFLEPIPKLPIAISAGLITGLCWVATSFGINYLFAQRSLKLFLIDAGYHTLQFTLYGLVLGLWP